MINAHFILSWAPSTSDSSFQAVMITPYEDNRDINRSFHLYSPTTESTLLSPAKPILRHVLLIFSTHFRSPFLRTLYLIPANPGPGLTRITCGLFSRIGTLQAWLLRHTRPTSLLAGVAVQVPPCSLVSIFSGHRGKPPRSQTPQST